MRPPFLFGALGVFFRDLSLVSLLLAQLAMFLAPICYPATPVPESFAVALDMSPLEWFVTVYCQLALDRQFISVGEWTVRIFAYSLSVLAAFAFFRRTRKSFAGLV